MSLLQNPPPSAQPAPSLTLNGQPLPWCASLTVEAVLSQQGYQADAVATAVNGEFVARNARPATPLNPGDQLTVFQAIVGG